MSPNQAKSIKSLTNLYLSKVRSKEAEKITAKVAKRVVLSKSKQQRLVYLLKTGLNLQYLQVLSKLCDPDPTTDTDSVISSEEGSRANQKPPIGRRALCYSATKAFLVKASKSIVEDLSEPNTEMVSSKDLPSLVNQLLSQVDDSEKAIREKNYLIGKHLFHLKENEKAVFKSYIASHKVLALKTAYGYIKYYKFVTFYSKFRKTNIPFSTIKNHLANIRIWFQSTDCRDRPSTDPLSDKFWSSN